jgi:hypothetical protein
VANTQELGITVVARESRGDRVERGYYREWTRDIASSARSPAFSVHGARLSSGVGNMERDGKSGMSLSAEYVSHLTVFSLTNQWIALSTMAYQPSEQTNQDVRIKSDWKRDCITQIYFINIKLRQGENETHVHYILEKLTLDIVSQKMAVLN